MNRRAWLLSSAAALVVWARPSLGRADEVDDYPDYYLIKPRGSYRGRVIDAETKEPLKGAVAVALWRRVRILPLTRNTERYAAMEAVTDADGRFVMDARKVEEGAPRRTTLPEFFIFQPGYGAYPRHGQRELTAEERRTGKTRFEGEGETVELPRLTERRDRLNNLSGLDASRFADRPQVDLPHLSEAVARERLSLGLTP